MAAIVSGAIGGIVGGVLMLAVMQLLGGDDPPPFAVFWAQFVADGRSEDAMPTALVLHFGYALVAGLVYVPVFGAIGGAVGEPFVVTAIAGGVVWGLAWALVLFVVAAFFWIRLVLDIQPELESEVLTMGAAHLVYGLSVGLWLWLVPSV